VTQPKYVLKAQQRLLKVLDTKDRYAEGRTNTRRRLKRLLAHPEYGRKLAQLDAKEQDRILTRVHSPFMVSAKKKQQLIFADIDSSLKGKKKRLAKHKKSRELGIRGRELDVETKVSRYAALSPEARSDLWPADESTEFWDLYKREMGYVR